MRAIASRFPWRVYVLALALIVLFAAAPLIGAVIASWLAEANGCLLNEGSVNPCMILGMDWGGTLYTLFVLGWFMLATLPLGGGALIVFVIVFIIHYLAWRNAQDAQ